MTDKQIEEIFKKNFEAGMVVKNFAAFKRSHPTLLQVIKTSMKEVSNPDQAKTNAVRDSFA